MSRYLQADYLSPLSPQGDCKTNPLAMLMQTCNKIGHEDGSNIELDDQAPRKTHTPPRNLPYSPVKTTDMFGLASDDRKRSSSPESNSNQHVRRGNSKVEGKANSHAEKYPHQFSKKAQNSKSNSEQNRHRRRHEDSGKSNNEFNSSKSPFSDSSDDSGPKRSPKSSEHSLRNMAPVIANSVSGTLAFPPTFSHPGLPSYLNQAFLSTLPLSATSALSTHKHSDASLTLTPIRTASGASTVVPLCNDPLCVNCKLTLQAAYLAPVCSPGCNQCPKDKSSVDPLSLSPLHSLFQSACSSGLPGFPPHLLTNSVSHTAALPFVCSWLSGGKYCGEKFSTSEGLLTHLRSHTSAPVPSLSDSLLKPLPTHPYSSFLPMFSQSPLYSPLSMSARAAYDRMSPSSYGLGSNRYHPYGLKPPGLGASGLPPPSYLHGLSPAALSALFNGSSARL